MHPLRRPLPAAAVAAAVTLSACLVPSARGAPLLVATAVIFFLRASSLAYVEPDHFTFLQDGSVELRATSTRWPPCPRRPNTYSATSATAPSLPTHLDLGNEELLR